MSRVRYLFVQSLLKTFQKLLTRERRRFLKFCVVGASGVPVNLLFMWIAFNWIFPTLEQSLRVPCASGFGFAVSVLTNFLLNDLWTWRDRPKNKGGFVWRLLRFYLVSSAGGAIQIACTTGLNRVGLHYMLAQLCGIALATAINYVVNNLWTFGDKTRN